MAYGGRYYKAGTVGDPELGVDTISGVDFPRGKLGFGAEGTCTDVSESTPLPTRSPGFTGMAVAVVSVSTSATALPSSALSNRRRLTLVNEGPGNVAIAASGASYAAGFKVRPWGTVTLLLGAGVTVYGYAEAGTVNVGVLEES